MKLSVGKSRQRLLIMRSNRIFRRRCVASPSENSTMRAITTALDDALAANNTKTGGGMRMPLCYPLISGNPYQDRFAD